MDLSRAPAREEVAAQPKRRTEIGSQDVKSVTTLVIAHPRVPCARHGRGPSRAARPLAVRSNARSRARRLRCWRAISAPIADEASIARVHPQDYIESHPRGCAQAWPGRPSMRTPLCRRARSRPRCAPRAAPSSPSTRVMGGRARNAFVSTRPPGHHAEVATPMGLLLLQQRGRSPRGSREDSAWPERVAIMDFDVHHGNGTQHIFWDDPTVMYASTHQMPHYPGTGARGGAREQ